jgi:ketosteroid isomerase-like protein
MSEENVEKIRRGFEAMRRGDVAAFLEIADEAVEYEPISAPLFGLGVIRGRAAVERFFTVDQPQGLADFRAEAVSIEDRGDVVLVHTRASATGTSSGAAVVLDSFGFFRFRDGKVIEFRDFETRAAALEAAGLSE